MMVRVRRVPLPEKESEFTPYQASRTENVDDGDREWRSDVGG